MRLKFPKIKIRITFAFAVFLAYMCNVARGESLALAFASSIVHECVHLAFLTGYSCKGICVTLNPGGAAIQCRDMEFLEAKKQALTLLSAPAVNLLTGVALAALGKHLSSQRLLSWGYINIALGTVNLLPLSFLDGGRALRAILPEKYSPERTLKILSLLQYIGLSLLCGGALVLSFMRINAAGLIVFTAYCLIAAIRQQKRG